MTSGEAGRFNGNVSNFAHREVTLRIMIVHLLGPAPVAPSASASASSSPQTATATSRERLASNNVFVLFEF